MKVLFLNPPVTKGEKAPDRNFGCNYGLYFQHPLNLLYPATFLKENKINVEIIDGPVDGITPSRLLEKINEGNYDVYVFFSVFLSETLDLKWAKSILKLDKKAKIVFIGPEPSYKFDTFLIDPRVFVVRGESERGLLDLIKEFEKINPNFKRLKGLSWRSGSKIVHNIPREILSESELNKLPLPDRKLLKNYNKYFNIKLTKMPTTVMMTSRGCPYQCIFCIPSAFTFAREIEFKLHNNNKKPPSKMRSAQNIIKEFELVKKQGFKSVAIMDDNFLWNEKRTIEIMEGIKNLNLEWGCLARANFLQNIKVLKQMKKAGCKYIDIGVESFNQEILDYVKKQITVSEIYSAIKNLKKVGIEPKINILFGSSPLQTKEDIKNTVRTLKKLDIKTVSFSVVIPHPMTTFYRIVKEKGWFATNTRDFQPADTYRKGTVDFPNLTHKELEKLVKWAYRSFYLRPSYLLKRLKEIKNLNQLRGMTRSAIRLFLGV